MSEYLADISPRMLAKFHLTTRKTTGTGGSVHKVRLPFTFYTTDGNNVLSEEETNKIISAGSMHIANVLRGPFVKVAVPYDDERERWESTLEVSETDGVVVMTRLAETERAAVPA